METVESYAQILIAAGRIGTPRPLPRGKREGLVRIREQLGMRGELPAHWGEDGAGAGAPGSLPAGAAGLEAMMEQVTERVIAALRS